MRTVLPIILSALIAVSSSCGDDGGATSDAGADANIGPDAELRTIAAVRLRQALAGAMWANPTVYPVLPVQVNVFGTAVTVTVKINGVEVSAEDADNDNIWTALVDVSGLSEATPYDVVAAGIGLHGKIETHEATLTLGSNGIRLTNFAEVGAAASPRVHNVRRELWVTWADERDAARELWLARLDGAGVPLPGYETPVCIVCDADETLHGRVAAGDASLAVLYQKAGAPFTNWFKLVDGDGNNITPPIALDPAGWNGSFGGDVLFDGEHFIVVWRINDGAGAGEIRWMRVHGSTGEVTGPIVVASSGDGSPVGGFEPFSFVKATSLVDTTLVSFVRQQHHSALNLSLPRAQLVTLDRDGNITSSTLAEPETLQSSNFESRVFRVDDGALLLWSAQNLTTTAPIPTTFRVARIDPAGALDPKRGSGTIVVSAPAHRVEPIAVAHNVHLAALAWLDKRSSGGIELYTAPMAQDLSAGNAVVFPHARFIEGTAQLDGIRAGTNVVLVWLDERNGGIADSRPEVWLETVWY